MNKFIELSAHGEKHLFHVDTIFEIEPLKSGCRVYQTVYAPGGIDFTSAVVDESYETVKAMLDNGERVAITAEIVEQALTAWQDEPCGDCSGCKYYSDTTGRCEAKYVADYINKKMRGESK